MTTTTLSHSEVGFAPQSGRGFFRRLLDAVIATREMEAKRHIAQHLSIYSDAQLKEMGFTREEVARWQSAGSE